MVTLTLKGERQMVSGAERGSGGRGEERKEWSGGRSSKSGYSGHVVEKKMIC